MLAAAFGQQQVVGPSLDKIVKPDLLVSLLDRIHDPAQVCASQWSNAVGPGSHPSLLHAYLSY